jgi:hypothetical protein
MMTQPFYSISNLKQQTGAPCMSLETAWVCGPLSPLENDLDHRQTTQRENNENIALHGTKKS